MAEPQDQEDVVAGVAFSKTSPTRLSYEDLHSWVIWQFPRQKNGGLCGAVRPPVQQHGWIPAVILVQKKSVEVYAHLKQSYPTPEAAAEHFNANHS